MATNNGYSGTLVPRIGYTRSVCFRNRVRRSFGQSGAVLGVFLYLIFAVPGNGYLTTGYTRSWLFPFYKWQTPESGIPPSERATRRYTKVHLDFCLRFSTLIGQIGRVPLFGSGPRRYIRSRLFRLAVTVFWRALNASWRQKASESRSFLGPFALQNCLRILRP